MSLIRKDEYQRIGSPALEMCTRVFTRFGDGVTVPFEKFNAKICIDNTQYEMKLYVVSARSLPWKIVLGQDFLEDVKVKLCGGGGD